MPREQNGTLALVVGYRVGSRHEQLGKTGLAHLFEHMMFRGTESFPEPFQTLAEWGSQFNAFTSTDQTIYHEMVPAQKLDEALKFESERMRKLLITPQVFNTERGAVVSERKMSYEDSPGGRLHWEMHQLGFDKHPYKTIPIGWQDDIERATFEDALSFYHKYYAPDRATLVLIGDFQLDEAKKIIEKDFGGYAAAGSPEPDTPKENLHRKDRSKTIHLKTQTAILGEGVFSPTYTSPDAAAELFLCVLMGDSSTGYLQHALVEQGIARGISASCYPDVDPGISILKIVATPGVSASVLRKKYDDAIKSFLSWANNERFENSKKYFETSQLESLRNPMDLATTLASNNTTSGDPLYTFKLVDAVKALTFKDIEKRFREREKMGHTEIIIAPSEKNDPMVKDSAKVPSTKKEKK